MFTRNKMKESAKITDRDPTFKVRYIGNMETFQGSGRGCTTPLVQKLWDNSEEEQFLPKMKIKLTTSGIHMKRLDRKKVPEKLFGIENISFCTVDAAVSDRIFAWIYREADDKQFECHAVFCSSTEKAKTMSLVLSRAFQIAYKEWKSRQTKSLRDKSKTQRSVSMYTTTANKIHEPLVRHQSDALVTSSSSFSNDHITGNGNARTVNGRMSVDESLLVINSQRLNGDMHQIVETENVSEKL